MILQLVWCFGPCGGTVYLTVWLLWLWFYEQLIVVAMHSATFEIMFCVEPPLTGCNRIPCAVGRLPSWGCFLGCWAWHHSSCYKVSSVSDKCSIDVHASHNSACCKYLQWQSFHPREYECPQPNTRIIMDCITKFKQAINLSLKSGSTLIPEVDFSGLFQSSWWP